MNLTELKAQAYDILANMEQLNAQMEQLKNQLVEVNKQIADEYAKQQEPVKQDEETSGIVP